MEVFVVHSLVELLELRHMLRAFPVFVFIRGYVRIGVQVDRIDCLGHSSYVKMILDGMTKDLDCEVFPRGKWIDDVSDLSKSLIVLKGIVNEATSDVHREEVYAEEGYRLLGTAAQVVFENGRFAGGSFGDKLFSVTKAAISCANTGIDLFGTSNERRWTNFFRRLHLLEFDIDYLLHCPVYP